MKITQYIEFFYGANGNEHVKETKRRPNIRQHRLKFANSTEKFQTNHKHHIFKRITYFLQEKYTELLRLCMDYS